MKPGAPALFPLTKHLPQSWRKALLRALAYPEHEVAQVLLHPEPGRPFGRVWLHPIEGSLIEAPYPSPDADREARDGAHQKDQTNIVEFKR